MNKAIVKDYYESHAQQYNRTFFETTGGYPTLLYRQQHMLAMIDALALSKNEVHILDAGCGTGDMVNALARRGYRVSASDIAQEMVDIALQKNQAHTATGQVTICQADVENLPYADNFFDVYILSGVIEYLPGDDEWLKQALRVIKPGGYIVLNVTNKISIRRLSQQPFEWLKSLGFMRSFAGFIKQKILRKGPLHYFNFRIRTHKPRRFDRWMAAKGFEKKAQAYFDYCFLPYPLDTLIPLGAKKKLEATAYKNRYLRGCGYIILAQKKA